uniref:hypothetical protein n=1 Tax=Rubrivivax gelatinosus TaxID=28068 RepID=UPI0005C22286
ALLPGAQAWWPSAGTLALDARADGRWPSLRSEGRLDADGLKSSSFVLQHAQARWNLATEDAKERLDASVAGTLGSHRIVVQAQSPLKPPAWTDAAPAPAAGPTTLSLRAGGA